jgi:hypothetical protein
VDRILESVRASRRALALRPRSDLVKEIEERIAELEGLPDGSVPSFALDVARKALRDLTESRTEEEILLRVSEWVRIGISDKNVERRYLTRQLGSFLLQADMGDVVRDDGSHDWRTVANNRLNFTCARCGIVGYMVGSGSGQPRAPYGCRDYRALTRGPEGTDV